jgi:hypothetical protein
MSIKLNKSAFENAKSLIEGGLEVNHEVENWEEAAPTRDEINKFIETHYMAEYRLWFLGINTDIKEDSIQKYEYPYGDLKIVYKSALADAAEKARENNHTDIADAADELIKLIDKKK